MVDQFAWLFSTVLAVTSHMPFIDSRLVREISKWCEAVKRHDICFLVLSDEFFFW